MFSIKQYVENKSSHKLELGNYATISRVKSESIDDNMLIHEGAIGVFDDTLKELSYDDLADKGKVVMPNVGWLGFSDKYWLTTLMPSASSEVISKFSVTSKNGINRYQASINSKDSQVISPGENGQWSIIYLFSGAKELELLDLYEKDLDIKLFDRAVDFGVLYFITKPIFELLHQLYDWVGNFGFAILLLTVLIKMLLFPLAHKGFKGMNRLKALQPKMMELKEKLSDKPQEFQKAMIDLYRKEKVNPMGGCLPIVLQIPIFFALYKVLYVTIEMRHAPFIWWIGDLSAPEGISIFNLFGLLSFGVPQFLMIGVFPILMALTMVIQQRLNPQPTDPIQAQVMRLLPLIFLFMFASFPSGLVIYWTWSNILSIAQQLLIKYLEKPKK
jgi:YidC/Oxa1 family membrane protein insertase